MLVTVLPFFLVARVPAGDERWRVDESSPAESVYDVLVNTTTIGAVDGIRACSLIRTELRCRAKGEDSLSCRFHRPESRSSLRTSPDCDLILRGDRLAGLDVFEIRFDRRGVENLVVPRTTPRHRLDAVKAIAGQLSVGVDLQESRDVFETVESGSWSRCRVRGNVFLEHDASDPSTTGGYELSLLPTVRRASLARGHVLEIGKFRDPEDCPRRAVYVFAENESRDRGNASLFMKMTTSTSRMKISKHHFSSYTASEGVLQSPEGILIARPFQTISVTLKRIEIARREEVPEIRNPASTGLHTFSHLGYASALVEEIETMREMYKRRK